MIEYNEKVLQIHKYLTDVINDKMLEDANKGYLRITKEGSEDYGHESIIFARMFYLDILQKIYLYFSFDKNIKWGDSDRVKEYYYDIMNYLYTNCRNDINCTISLLGPSYMINNTICSKGSNVSRILTPYTIGYWIGTNDQYEFINDPEITLIDKYKHDLIENYTASTKRKYLKNLKEERDILNKEYNCIYNPNLIPTVFEKYRQKYLVEVGINLPTYDMANHSSLIKILNATDFYGTDHY